MHFKVALVQEQPPLHPRLHPQRSGSLHDLVTSGSVVQEDSHSPSLKIHPQSPGEGRSGLGWARCRPGLCPNSDQLDKQLCFVCCNRAALVGRIASYARPFCAGNFFLVSLTLVLLLVLSYSKMTKRSRRSMHASLIGLVGVAASCRKISVTAGKLFQTVNAVFLPLPAKQDTVSHPVKALHTGRALDIPTPGCLISHVQLCNENESQFPLQSRLLLVVPAAPEEFRRMLLPEQGHLCRLYEAQACGSPPGLRLQHAKSSLCPLLDEWRGARFVVLLHAGLNRISLP